MMQFNVSQNQYEKGEMAVRTGWRREAHNVIEEPSTVCVSEFWRCCMMKHNNQSYEQLYKRTSN